MLETILPWLDIFTAAWLFMGRGARVSRGEAVILLVAYAAALPLVTR